MNRQSLLLILIVIFAAACQQQEEALPKLQDPLEDFLDSSLKPFYYGVASGDPLTDAVIIWTKVSPEDSVTSLEVSWEVSENQEFSIIQSKGVVVTNADKGYTVKVDVKGLSAGQYYYYRFNYEDTYSPVGRTKTVPAGDVDSLKFAVVSCSNYEFGPFNAYGALAERQDIHAVIHLGDYIYEYGEKVYGDTTTGRFHLPPHEIVSLSDYRIRYAQYRLDTDLREVHQMHPFITVWDDHEIANDAYKDGAQNHQPEEEGPYETRRSIARKVYYEWLPVRPSEKLYRTFEYGDMAELIMLDERLAGRTAQVDSVTDPTIADQNRAMLGEAQMSWFKEELSSSTSRWKVIGNQVIFSYLDWGFPTFSINLDSWDGYPRERADIMKSIKENNIQNVVFVTGDTHSSWALEVTSDPFHHYRSNGAVAVEYGTASINAGNSNERSGASDELVKDHEKRIVSDSLNPHLKYANLRDHGYLELALYKDRAAARWYYTPSRVLASREMVLAMEKVTPLNSNAVLEKE